MKVMELTIRHATIYDIPSMYGVSLRSHQASYDDLIPPEFKAKFDVYHTDTPERKAHFIGLMAERLKSGAWEFWVAIVNGKIVGYTLQERTALHRIRKRGLFVDPQWYSHGIGTALFEASLAAAKIGDTIQLSVIVGNTRAKHIYSKYGFASVNVQPLKWYYGAPLEVMEWRKSPH